MKKVIIEDAWDSFSVKMTGIKKFTINLENLCQNLNYDIVKFDKNFLKNIKNPTLMKLVYFFWLNTFFLYKLLKIKKEVVVIGVKYFIPFFKLPNVKYYPVIHDLTAIKYPQTTTKSAAFILKTMTKNAIVNGDKILTVSETARNEIAEYYNYPLDRISVIYNTFSLDKNINIDEKTVLDKYTLDTKNYILSVSSLHKHKNIESLILAFNDISIKFPHLKLLLVGSGSQENFLKGIANKNVIFTGHITDEEIKVLYKNAKIYAFPSKMEGFGIPIIDAQNFGIPIICSNIDVFKEVAGEDGAIFVDFNEKDFAKGIEKILESDDLEKQLIKNGIINIRRFEKENLEKLLKSGLSVKTTKTNN